MSKGSTSCGTGCTPDRTCEGEPVRAGGPTLKPFYIRADAVTAEGRVYRVLAEDESHAEELYRDGKAVRVPGAGGRADLSERLVGVSREAPAHG